MDVGSTTAAAALDAALAAWAEAVAAGEGDAAANVEADSPGEALARAASQPPARDGFAERILGTAPAHADADATTLPSHVPGARADSGVESATVQSFTRPPQVPAGEAPRPTDTALPAAFNAASEFAVPAAQLVPVTLIGLQVEPAAGWPLTRHGAEPAAPERSNASNRDGAEPPVDDGEPADDDVPQHEPDEQDKRSNYACELVFDDDADGADGCEALTRALNAALAARIPPQALLAAADQWRRGRCVVLACPQGADPAGPAWAFVLWPRPQAPSASRRAQPGSPPLALFGRRVEARLQWSAPPHEAQWCHVRVVKEHHPQRGRQLVALDAAGTTGRIACEVQLGPVLARSLRWCEVRLRINAVRRFWAALGGQWSVHVVVASQPLAGVRILPMEGTSC